MNAAEHGEWLPGEALAETFPASDPIAVSPYSAEVLRSVAQAGKNVLLARKLSQHKGVAVSIATWCKAANAHGK